MTTAGRPEAVDVAANAPVVHAAALLMESLDLMGLGRFHSMLAAQALSEAGLLADPALLDCLAEAEAKVARVEAMHQPDEYEHESPNEPHIETYCRECSNYGRRSFVRYPCRTRAALTGGDR